MAEFTKDELVELLKIQEKTTQQLTQIVIGLTGIEERQNRILLQVENGIAKKISESLERGCVDCRKCVTEIGKNVMWLKIFLGLVGLSAFILLIFKLVGH